MVFGVGDGKKKGVDTSVMNCKQNIEVCNHPPTHPPAHPHPPTRPPTPTHPDRVVKNTGAYAGRVTAGLVYVSKGTPSVRTHISLTQSSIGSGFEMEKETLAF